MAIVTPALGTPSVIHLIALKNTQTNDTIIVKTNALLAEVLADYWTGRADYHGVPVTHLMAERRYETEANLFKDVSDAFSDNDITHPDLPVKLLNAPVLIARGDTEANSYAHLLWHSVDFPKIVGMVAFDGIGGNFTDTLVNKVICDWFNFH